MLIYVHVNTNVNVQCLCDETRGKVDTDAKGDDVLSLVKLSRRPIGLKLPWIGSP